MASTTRHPMTVDQKHHCRCDGEWTREALHRFTQWTAPACRSPRFHSASQVFAMDRIVPPVRMMRARRLGTKGGRFWLGQSETVLSFIHSLNHSLGPQCFLGGMPSSGIINDSMIPVGCPRQPSLTRKNHHEIRLITNGDNPQGQTVPKFLVE